MGFEINHVTVSGNLTRDPELRSTRSGTAVLGMRIANNQRRKNQATGEWEDEAHYFDVTVWGGFAEWLARNLSKGEKVVVSGQLRWREWQAQDGSKRQSVSINAYDVVPVPRNGGGGGGNFSGRETGFTPRSDVPIDDRDFQPVGGGGGGGRQASPADDDIPF